MAELLLRNCAKPARLYKSYYVNKYEMVYQVVRLVRQNHPDHHHFQVYLVLTQFLIWSWNLSIWILKKQNNKQAKKKPKT